MDKFIVRNTVPPFYKSPGGGIEGGGQKKAKRKRRRRNEEMEWNRGGARMKVVVGSERGSGERRGSERSSGGKPREAAGKNTEQEEAGEKWRR